MMSAFVPKKIFFTKGVGNHKEELHSFELALRDAGIEKCNLVQVSSILPPGCQVISRARGLKELKQVYEEIDRLEKTEITVKEYRLTKEHWFPWLAAALALLLLERAARLWARRLAA